MSGSPFASVIIPNYNGEDIIADCLQSVYSLDYPNFEVILVDDASSDNSLAIIGTHFPKVRVIKNTVNAGFARAVNKGIKQAKGEIIALLNMDTVVKKDWLSGIVKALTSDKEIAIVGSKILDPDGKTIQHAGGIINDNAVPSHIGRGEPDTGQYDELKEVDYVCGASLGFRRSLLEQIGYLDQDYSGLYYEDTDLAFRAKKRGYKTIYTPHSVLIHKENFSTNGLTKRFYYLFHKNRLHFVIKNYSLKYFFMKFLKIEIKLFMHFKPEEFKPQLIEAYLVNILFLPYLLFSRILRSAQERTAGQ